MIRHCRKCLSLWVFFWSWGALLLGCQTFMHPTEKPETAIASIHYVARYVAPDSIEVEGDFVGSETGQTSVVLPTELFAAETPYDGVRDLEFLGDKIKLVGKRSKTIVIVQHPPAAVVRFKYTFKNKASDEFLMDSPTVNASYFHFNGSLFAHPRSATSTNIQVQLDWELPATFQLANSYGVQTRHQEFTGNFAGSAQGDIRYTVFVGGDFRVHAITVHSRPVYFAIRGRWKIPDRKFIEIVHKVIETQRGFWQDYDIPFYLVALLPKGKACCGYGGHGLTHSFVAFLTEDEYSTKRFAHVLAHEHFHHWNGEKIAPKYDSPVYWFTEGFTEFYAHLLNFRSGLIDYADFVDEVNTALYRYYSSAKRLAPEEEIERMMNRDGDVTKLAYGKGLLIASEWNWAIHNRSGGNASLDDLMHSLLAASQQGAVLSNALIERTLTEFLGPVAKARFEAEVMNGDLLHPTAEALGVCAQLTTAEMPLFELGYEVNESSQIVTAVKPDSRAQAAGLRVGQQILEKQFEEWVPWHAIRLRVRSSDSNPVWIDFLPQKKSALLLPGYVVNKNADDKTCLRAFDQMK